MRASPLWRRTAALLTCVVAAACSRPKLSGFKPVAPIDPAAVQTTLFLIGDAGAPVPDDPVLVALARQLRANPESSVVVFLGDNVYPRGLVDSLTPGHEQSERYLLEQIEVATSTRTRTYFVPGNHDWDYMGPGGLAAVRYQADFIRARGAPWARMLPTGGCPGPVTVDVGSLVRLVFLDTQWWLHYYVRPLHPDSDCPADSPQEVMDSLASTLGSAGGRHVVVAGHHPMESGGKHGGYFGWDAHLFPLRALRPWLWVPLPVVGSFVVLTRKQGATDQDLGGPRYERMRRSLGAVFERYRPLVYASGHDHDIQVIEGKTARNWIVSGTGFYGHVTDVLPIPGTKYAGDVSGFVRLDVLRDRRVRLGVIAVDANARISESYSAYLELEDEK